MEGCAHLLAPVEPSKQGPPPGFNVEDMAIHRPGQHFRGSACPECQSPMHGGTFDPGGNSFTCVHEDLDHLDTAPEGVSIGFDFTVNEGQHDFKGTEDENQKTFLRYDDQRVSVSPGCSPEVNFRNEISQRLMELPEDIILDMHSLLHNIDDDSKF